MLVSGPNGTGKTTLLRTVAGLIEPEEGDVRWRSRSIRDDRQHYHGDVAWFAHKTGFKGDLSIDENLRVDAGLQSLDLTRLGEVLDAADIGSRRSLPFRVLSAGQQRRASLARLMLGSATLWLMDEPLTNLDAEGQALVITAIRDHLARDGACLLASHQPIDDFPGLRRMTLK